MEIKATANLMLQVSGGPAIVLNWTISGDAFDRATVNVPAKGKTDVLLQPGDPQKLLVLIISASKYSDKLSYKLDAAGPSFAVTQPQIVTGGDLLKELAKNAGAITFENALKTPGTDDITVDLFAIRTS